MFKESPQQFEQTLPPESKKITSFEELYNFIEAQGKIYGSQKIYSPNDLRKIIEKVRHGHLPIKWVTSAMGIRDTVERLLANDKVYLKYTQGSRAKKK